MRTRTKLLAALLACLMFLTVGSAFAEGETVTINFWHHYSAQSAENETLMNVLIPAFEAENPGIKVNAVSHEWAELHDKVLVSAKSNALPDVARCDIAWLPEFQKMGILVALDEEMPDFAEVSGKLLDSAMSTSVIAGHNYALALNTNSKIVFYNKAMLEEAGVQVPATMDEWVEAVKKLSGENANGQQVWGWNEPALAGWNICPFIWSFGGSLTNEDQTVATGYINGPAAVKAVERIDQCVGAAVDAVKKVDGVLFICADHGNAEQMINYETKAPHTAHTTNPVPFILVNYDDAYTLREGGKLCDIAPTLLEIMGLPQPAEMTGKSLLIK